MVVAVVAVAAAAVVEVGVVGVAVVVVLEPCVEADELFLTGFGKIGFAAADGVKVLNVSGSVRLAVKMPLAVGWVMCDLDAVAVAFAGRCVAEVVADGHSA